MIPQTRSVIIGTAGHIDHGKTLLVKSLTGTDTDRLPEEKKRGITIDLGFASTDAETPDGTPLSLSFVDVPGHKLFVRNMLAGAGGIDCVMLVISADDGVMPQTEEHLDICTFLGIQRGLAVLTKVDLVSEERLQEVQVEVRTFLANSFLHDAPLLPVSAVTGRGAPELREALIAIAARVPPRSATGLVRLPLDRAFTMKGFGTVVTGTLQGGTLQRGQALILEPGGVAVRARGLQMHGRGQEQVVAGSRAALNLTGVDVEDVHRGMTLVAPASVTAVDTIDVELQLLPDAPELRHRARVQFHSFTSETIAAVSLYDYRALTPGGRGLLRLKLANPVVLLPGDRFVLRRPSPPQTLGGGRILDAHPLPHTRKKKALRWLEEIRDASPEDQLRLRIQRRGPEGISIAGLGTEMGLTNSAVEELATLLVSRCELVSLPGGLYVSRDAFAAASEFVMAALTASGNRDAFSGVRRSELRNHAGLGPEMFDAVLDRLVRERKVRVKDESVALYSEQEELPDADRQRIAAITSAYERAGLQAPLLAEVIRSVGVNQTEARRLVTQLLRSKILVKLGTDDLLMHESALAALRSRVQALRGEKLDVARFKQITGLSRKYAIPLLEYLDREHVTRKAGEIRLVL